jgi:uncharacterized SAM-binding protein YcdF (DUF218 family)
MKTIEDITDFIFINDEPCKVDAIFVVGGSLQVAGELTAELYNNGYAKNIIIGGKYSIKRDCFPLPEYETEFDFYKDILVKNGVSEADIFGEACSTYTKQNAEFAKQVVDKNNLKIKSAIIICKSFHAKRCLLFYQMYFPYVDFKVVTFDGFDISKDNWYKTDYGRKRVFGELKRIKEQVPNAETLIINEEELDKIAIDLLCFLVNNNMTFQQADGYWKNPIDLDDATLSKLGAVEGCYMTDIYCNGDIEIIVVKNNSYFDINVSKSNINDENLISLISNL